jgi:aspartyl-tRNA(Asn)/glutamyl-tRNA(Gln) amidotransferase subunit A
MIPFEPTRWTISTVSKAIAKKELSPVEVVQACLDRIESYDKWINAFITVLPKQAMKSARRAEKEILRGRYIGPLHGIPYAAKDLFFVKGIRNTCGSKILTDFIPSYDAAVIERLSSAGAVLLGKLNMHEFANGPTSVNPHYGPVHNPWDFQRISGGSSGGSAAALVASFALLTLGTDTGGSIRIPAALCGCTGLKPTYGRISRYGAYPLAWSLDHPGPMAKTAADIALAMNVLAGYDHRDPGTSPSPVPDYVRALRGDLERIRVGVPTGFYFERLAPEVRASVKKAIKDLEELGAEVRSISIPHLKEAAIATSVIIFTEMAASLEKWHVTRSADLGDDVRARLNQGSVIPAVLYLKAQRFRRMIQEDFAAAFRKVDVIVTPQLPITAPIIGQGTVSFGKITEPVPSALTRLTRIYNLLGIPCISVCCGFSSAGMPIGLQIASKPFSEDTVLKVAHGYEAHTPWKDRRPAFG